MFKPLLWGVADVAHFIPGNEQTQLPESATFFYLVYSLLPKYLTIQNLSMVIIHI